MKYSIYLCREPRKGKLVATLDDNGFSLSSSDEEVDLEKVHVAVWVLRDQYLISFSRIKSFAVEIKNGPEKDLELILKKVQEFLALPEVESHTEYFDFVEVELIA